MCWTKELLDRCGKIRNSKDLFEAFYCLPEKGSGWIFRGDTFSKSRHQEQPGTNPGAADLNQKKIKSSLDKVFHRFGTPPKWRSEVEQALLREFQRRAYHYSVQLPNQSDLLEWLALMQHYRAPTRLVDWSYSFFVAAYFALCRAAKDGVGIVWGCRPGVSRIQRKLRDYLVEQKVLSESECKKMNECDREALPPDLRDLMLQDQTYRSWSRFSCIICPKPEGDPPPKSVCCVNPFRLNERLTAQQGVFLCPTNVKYDFQENFEGAFEEPSEDHVRCWKIEGSEAQQEVLKTLNRMNVNQATLFPGLEGFAESLRTHPMISDRDMWVPICSSLFQAGPPIDVEEEPEAS